VARFSKRAFLDIELKVPSLAQQVVTALREHIPERGYAVSSFLADVLVEVREYDESIPLGIIANGNCHRGGTCRLNTYRMHH